LTRLIDEGQCDQSKERRKRNSRTVHDEYHQERDDHDGFEDGRIPILALVKSAFTRLAFVKSALRTSAPVKSAPSRSVSLND
jgi:hypothetical protein